MLASYVYVFCAHSCRKQYKSIVQKRVELVKVEREVEERSAGEERLQEEIRKKQAEEDKERVKMLQEERQRKAAEEQRLKTVEDEKIRQQDAQRRKHAEEKEKTQQIELLTDDSDLVQESLGDDKQQRLQSTQHKGKLSSKPQKLPKFDEENRLLEQLKLLQEQAARQKENEQKQKISTDTSFTAGNNVDRNEKLKKKCKRKETVRKDVEDQSQLEEESQKQKDLAKMQEMEEGRDEMLRPEKLENVKSHKRRRKLDSKETRLEDVTRKDAEKSEELSTKKVNETVQQDNLESDVSKVISLKSHFAASQEKQNLMQSEKPVAEKCGVPVQPSAKEAFVEQDLKLKRSSHLTENVVKHEHSQSVLQNKSHNHSSSNVSVQNHSDTKCQVRNSICKKSCVVWERNIEAKRLKWMHKCESWR